VKIWYKSRTIIANVLMAVLPILSLTEFAAVLPREWLPYYALLMVLANMLLRAITTSAVKFK